MTTYHGRRVVGLAGVLIATATIATPTSGSMSPEAAQWPVLPPYIDRSTEADLVALREFDRRLRIYPQFGDPLIDLLAEAGQVRIGVVPPLAMRYGVLEERRIVLVAAPPVLLPSRGSP